MIVIMGFRKPVCTGIDGTKATIIEEFNTKEEAETFIASIEENEYEVYVIPQ